MDNCLTYRLPTVSLGRVATGFLGAFPTVSASFCGSFRVLRLVMVGEMVFG